MSKRKLMLSTSVSYGALAMSYLGTVGIVLFYSGVEWIPGQSPEERSLLFTLLQRFVAGFVCLVLSVLVFTGPGTRSLGLLLAYGLAAGTTVMLMLAALSTHTTASAFLIASAIIVLHCWAAHAFQIATRP